MPRTTPPLIVLCDSQARILWASHTHPPLTLRDVLGKKVWTWEHDPHVVRQAFSRTLLDGTPQEFTTTAVIEGEMSRWQGYFWPVNLQGVAVISVGFLLRSGPEPTKRERDVLRLLANGLTPYKAAETLGISPNTLYTYLSRLRVKTRHQTVAGVVSYATAAGWI